MDFAVGRVVVEQSGSQPQALGARELGVFGQESSRDPDVHRGRLFDARAKEPAGGGARAGFRELLSHTGQLAVAQISARFALRNFECLHRRLVSQFLSARRVEIPSCFGDGQHAEPVLTVLFEGLEPPTQLVRVFSLRPLGEVVARVDPGGRARFGSREGKLDQAERQHGNALGEGGKTEQPFDALGQTSVRSSAVPGAHREPAREIPTVSPACLPEGRVGVPHRIAHQRCGMPRHVRVPFVLPGQRPELLPHSRLVAGFAALDGRDETRLVDQRTLPVGFEQGLRRKRRVGLGQEQGSGEFQRLHGSHAGTDGRGGVHAAPQRLALGSQAGGRAFPDF